MGLPSEISWNFRAQLFLRSPMLRMFDGMGCFCGSDGHSRIAMSRENLHFQTDDWIDGMGAARVASFI